MCRKYRQTNEPTCLQSMIPNLFQVYCEYIQVYHEYIQIYHKYIQIYHETNQKKKLVYVNFPNSTITTF